MSLYSTAVRKPVSTILIFIGVIVFGLFSLNRLSIDLYPEIDPPIISVFTTYPGANAADIETNITRLLEDNLNTVSDLKKLTSSSRENISLIILEFEWGTNLDEATNDVRDAISRIERYLPEDSEKPVIFKFSTSMMPILMLSATAEESYSALNKILDERIVNPLNRIDGVGAVGISGGPKREIQVNVDPRKLEAYNLTVEQLGNAIRMENLNMPAGTIDLGSKTFPLRVQGEFSDSDVLNDIVVGSFAGRQIKLKDVAVVKDTLAKLTMDERRNGMPAARIIVQKQSGANTVKISKEVLEQLPILMRTLPPDITIDTIFDSSEFIENSIDSLTIAVLFAGIFVMLVVLFFLGRWRATFIIILTIPVSLIVSFIYLYVTGNSINIISLSSLSIAIGMVVDDAIVVLENITKHIERGSSPREASIYGTNEVGLAVVATTLTVVAVFFPLTLVGGLSGIMFKQLGWIVTIVVVVSTIAALSLTPMLSSQMLRLNPPRRKGLAKLIFDNSERMLTAIDNFYVKTLSWAIRHRVVVVVAAIVVFASSMLLVGRVGTEFIPPSDNARVAIEIELPMGIRVEKTQQVARDIEAIIQNKYPEVEMISTSSGSADDRNIFSAMGSNGSHIINMTLRLSSKTERERDIYLISDLIREDLAQVPDISSFSVTPGGGGGFGGQSQLEVIISGYDLDVSGEFARELAERMKSIPGTRDVDVTLEESRPEYQVEFDREKLAFYGLNTTTASTFVRNRINGLVAAKYREDGDEYDIVVRYAEPFRESIESIENILIYNNQGRAVRVKDVGAVKEYSAPPFIERENRQRVVKVTSALYKASLTDVVSNIWAEIDKMEVPQGIGIDIGGDAEQQQESFADLFSLLLLIIMLVYIVMATQFESLRSPFIIMFTIPFAFTGVILSLWLTGETLNLISMIGSVMLVGIVVKNGIVLVDYTNLMRDRGLSLSQAVLSSGRSRLRPVLMTTLTTVLGMLPLAIGFGEGSEIWRPMGVAIMGGLTFSTVITLVLIPVVYTMFGANRLKKERKRMEELVEGIN
ncbi:efflux RND transporter permease subunit [Perlabentimonas gracilis]|uniref:efflux RND transporter permease subunit n=1 Tax=Perlabentimonas gracilis TaxID=2715279 RepID=UPI00140E3F45|nr:efflux RND transporter permease subunit [Perlabentimonas gracilis]NHB68683.1 efflux RND transporter permease subunit [Perlabentimonas gracilis]